MKRFKTGAGIFAVTTAIATPHTAIAQSLEASGRAEASADADEPDGGEQTEPEAEEEVATASPPEPEAEPEPEPEPEREPKPEPEPDPEVAEAPDEASETDHDRVVGGLGIGLLGSVPVRNTTAGFGLQTSNVPVLGARYWLTDMLALQVGAGFNTSSGVRKDDLADNENTNDPTVWNTAFHVGAPISFFDGPHYNLVVIPEAGLGYSSGRTKDNTNVVGDQGVKQVAWSIVGGVRAGAELQFGFIGIPHLSLQGAVGVQVNYTTSMIETVEDGVTVRRNYQRVTAGTTNFNEPWDLFIGTISALYYFDL